VLVKVGVKEFRENLADWLDRVEAGETEVLVTDRGKPKVRLVRADTQATLERLAAEGAITLPTKPKRPLPPPIPVEGSPVTDIILEHRGRPDDVL
jgi:prevent-host-death family protein